MTKKKDKENPQQLTLDIVLPKEPKETLKSALKRTTMLTALPTIVSEGFDAKHNGINWPHYENIWKLFALENVFMSAKPTKQQEIDRQELREAIEIAGNARYKRKHLTADEIIKRDSKVYVRYGKNIIRAKAERDPYASEVRLKDLRSDIYDTRSPENATQLRKVTHKVKAIYELMQARYNTR